MNFVGTTADLRQRRQRGDTVDQERPKDSDDVRAPSARTASAGGIEVGDRLIVRFTDDNKILSFELTPDRDDPVNGFVSVTSPLGSSLLGYHEEDEVEFITTTGPRRLLIVNIQRDNREVTQALAKRYIKRPQCRRRTGVRLATDKESVKSYPVSD